MNSDTYLTAGAGRYGWPSQANLVEKFFENSNGLPSGDYTRAELVTALGLVGVTANLDGDIAIPINNYQMDSGSDDWSERAYIFGASTVDLVDATFHIAADGTATISDIVIQPQNDNFDFTSETGLARTVNDLLLGPALNPDGLDGSGLDAGVVVALQGADDGVENFAPGSIKNFDNVIDTDYSFCLVA